MAWRSAAEHITLDELIRPRPQRASAVLDRYVRAEVEAAIRERSLVTCGCERCTSRASLACDIVSAMTNMDIHDPATYAGMREAARRGKIVIIERGPVARRGNEGKTVIVPIYEAHFTDGSGRWCEVIKAQRDELVQDGATVRNPEAEEAEEAAVGSGNSDLIHSGNSDHSGSPAGDPGPSISPTSSRGEARNDRHGQKTRNPGAAPSRAQPGGDGQAGRRLSKERSTRRG